MTAAASFETIPEGLQRLTITDHSTGPPSTTMSGYFRLAVAPGLHRLKTPQPPSHFLCRKSFHGKDLCSCPTRIRTWTNRIKICCANRYTIGQFCAGGPVSIRSASASGTECIGSLPTLASPHLAAKLAGWLSRWIRSPPFLVPPRRDSCQGFFTWCCVPVDPSCLSRESRLF